HGVALRRALKGIDGKVEQNLNQIGSVRLHANVFGQRLNREAILLHARVNVDQVAEVAQQLVDAHARRFVRLLAEETEITPGDFHAVGDLPRDDLQPVLDELEVFHAQA